MRDGLAEISEELAARDHFARRRLAPERERERRVDAVDVLRVRLLVLAVGGVEHALGKRIRRARDLVAVHQEQRLRRHIRRVALACDIRGLGEIEDIERLGNLVAHDRQVHAAMVVGRLHDVGHDAVLRSAARTAFGVGDGRARARMQVQRSGREQHRIADRLGLEALLRHAPEVRVVRVALRVLRVERARHLVRAREHDLADELLRAPAIGDEARGEMVEQRGIRRLLPAHAEVVGRRHDAVAEEMQPHAVRPHACGERVVLVGDPLRELESAAALGDRRLIALRDKLDESAVHDVAGLVELAAVEDARVEHLPAIGGAHRHEVRIGRLAALVVAAHEALRVARDSRSGAGAHDLLLEIRGEILALEPRLSRLLDELCGLLRLGLRALGGCRDQRAHLRRHRRAW